MPSPKVSEADIRRLVGDGLTDSQVAERLGVKRLTVWRWRTRLGLPAPYRAADAPEYVRRAWAGRPAENLRAGRLVGAAKRLAVAARYGLPPMRPKCVRVLLALLDGPLTRADICRRPGCGRETGTDPISAMVRGGFVARIYRRVGQRSRLPDVYMLTLKAMEYLDGSARSAAGTPANRHAGVEADRKENSARPGRGPDGPGERG